MITRLLSAAIGITLAMSASAQTPIPTNTAWAEQFEERDFDRQGYGDNTAIASALWTPLSTFETSLISTVREEVDAELTANQLLQLYLLASGNVRSAEKATELSARAWQFLAAHDDLRHLQHEEERGAALLLALHEDLFQQYDEAQSTVSGVLETGIYNCISSALIYMALARELGLQVRGVLMPSHAFVEVELADGTTLDVETTSEDGFAVVRDERFFARQAEGWFEERGLDVPSFEDYQQRRSVSALALGLENMWNQHLSPSRASYPMRLRIAEIRGAMQPDNLDAQQNRLVYYYQESDYLRRSNNPALRWQLLGLIEPVLERFEDDMAGAAALNDNQRIPLLLLQAARAQWLAAGAETPGEREGERQERWIAALQLSDSVLRTLDPDQREYESIRLDATIAVSDVIQGMTEKSVFAPLPPILSEKAEEHCLQTVVCHQSLDQFHAAWATHHWQQEQWAEAINVAREYLDWAPQSPNRAVFEQNMESAYLNQFATLWQQELRDQAWVWLQNCLQLPEPGRCEARYQEVESYFR